MRERTKLLREQQIQQSSIQIYHSILYLLTKQKIKHRWNNEWKTLVKPRLLTIKNDLYKNIIPPTLKIRDQVVISNIIIGHTKITNKYIFTKGNQPLCERCKTTLTIDHLILQCDVYLLLRKQLRVRPTLKDNLMYSGTSSSLLQYLKHTKICKNI